MPRLTVLFILLSHLVTNTALRPRNQTPALDSVINIAEAIGGEAGVEQEKRQQGNNDQDWVVQVAYEGETFFDGWEFFSKPGELGLDSISLPDDGAL